MEGPHVVGVGDDKRRLLEAQESKRNDVIVTPHNGAASVSSSIAMARMSAENILDCFDGQLKDEMVFNLSALGSKQ